MHDFNRFRNDPEHFQTQNSVQTRTVSPHSFHAQYPSLAAGTIIRRCSREHATRSIAACTPPTAETSLLASSFPRVGAGASQFQEIYRQTFRLYDLCRESSTPRFPMRLATATEEKISMLLLLLSQLATQLANESNRSDTVRHGYTWSSFLGHNTKNMLRTSEAKSCHVDLFLGFKNIFILDNWK